MSGCETGAVKWDAKAALHQRSGIGAGWARILCEGTTLAVAVNEFSKLSAEEQMGCDLFVDRGAIEGVRETLLGHVELAALAKRSDLSGQRH
jgi:hypothetical protein